MNRKEKRELKKDKSLICGLYNIIDKYLPRLFIMFENLTDVRQQGNQVSARRREYIDGQRQGCSHGWGAPGRLVSFSTEQIVVQYGNQLQAYDAQTGFKSWTSPVS